MLSITFPHTRSLNHLLSFETTDVLFGTGFVNGVLFHPLSSTLTRSLSGTPGTPGHSGRLLVCVLPSQLPTSGRDHRCGCGRLWPPVTSPPQSPMSSCAEYGPVGRRNLESRDLPLVKKPETSLRWVVKESVTTTRIDPSVWENLRLLSVFRPYEL